MRKIACNIENLLKINKLNKMCTTSMKLKYDYDVCVLCIMYYDAM